MSASARLIMELEAEEMMVNRKTVLERIRHQVFWALAERPDPLRTLPCGRKAQPRVRRPRRVTQASGLRHDRAAREGAKALK